MATWSVKPTWKKSIVEMQEWTKDGNTFYYEIGWRWGEFHVETEDDNPPKLKAGIDMFNCGYESEMIETSDGCWDEYHYDDCDDETREWLEEFFEEGNSVFELEEHGWMYGDCEMIIDCDLEITRINDDGTEGETFTTGSSDDEETEELTEEKIEPTKLNGEAKWPFGNEGNK